MNLYERILETIKGPIIKEELDVLREYAHKLGKDDIIIDIGTHAGKSTFSMAAATDAKVFTVDNTIFPEFAKNCLRLKMNPIFIFASSRQASKLLKLKGVKLVFVDADHSYEGVKKDAEKYCPLIETGGHIIFHDYVQKEAHKAINELEGKFYKRVDVIESLYIGEII